MTIKDLLSSKISKLRKWLRFYKVAKTSDYRPSINEHGLIDHESNFTGQSSQEQPAQRNEVVVKTVQPSDTLEKLREGFDRLVERLQSINEHLDRQVSQHEELMQRIDQLPKLLESLPAAVENQINMTDQLLEQLRMAEAKQRQFMDVVEKIPAETSKQTDALVNIDHELAAAADVDVQLTERFTMFNETLDKMNESTQGQTESIYNMSKAFAASDRYAKYLMSRQHKNFVWVFIIAIGVCVTAILILTGVIVYLAG